MNKPPDWLIKPQPPDDPDENAEFQEWVFMENGKLVTVRRKNPNYKPPETDELESESACYERDWFVNEQVWELRESR